MPFKKLEIIEPILRAIKSAGYAKPTPIQEHAIPILLSKKDIMGSAQTGTGKTAAFAIPILQNVTNSGKTKGIKALILTPTRELAMQIKTSFDTYGKYLPLKTVVVFGGVNQKSQVNQINKGADILVATPGRLLDLINQGIIKLDNVQYYVLDEADRMLDMGFIKDVKRITSKVPTSRQTMLFSATLPKSIINLANTILIDPVRVQITPVETTLDTIKQSLYYVKQADKMKLLVSILRNKDYTSILVFSRTKRNANKIVKQLLDKRVSAIAIHGNKSQSARTEALSLFKQKKARVLVATDLASRGLDIEDLSLVINYSLPDVPETYIHRIGRTGRANKNGIAISFCHKEELNLLKGIQKHIKIKIPVVRDRPYNVVFSEASSDIIPLTNSEKKRKYMYEHEPRKYSPKRKKSKYKKNYTTNRKKR